MSPKLSFDGFGDQSQITFANITNDEPVGRDVDFFQAYRANFFKSSVYILTEIPKAMEHVESRLIRNLYSDGFGHMDSGVAVRSARTHPSFRKFLRMVLPFSVRMLSGWNCTPQIGSVACLRPMTSSSSVQAVTISSGGNVSFLATSEW